MGIYKIVEMFLVITIIIAVVLTVANRRKINEITKQIAMLNYYGDHTPGLNKYHAIKIIARIILIIFFILLSYLLPKSLFTEGVVLSVIIVFATNLLSRNK